MSKRILIGTIIFLTAAVVGLGYLVLQNDSTGSTTSATYTKHKSAQESFKKFSSDDVVQAIHSARLPLQDVKDQPIGGTAAPATEVESKEFVIPAIAPHGGQILIFDSQQNLDAKKAWFNNYPDLAPYVYVRDNTILQLNSGLPAADAAKYKAALEQM